MPPSDAPLGQLLRAATSALHHRVERGTFMSHLLRGQMDRAGYIALLHNLHALYAALEDALSAHARTPAVAPVVMPALFRRAALAADLKALGATPPAPPLARAMHGYVERLREIAAREPRRLVAHAYVRYLGDLNGGQALRRVVARSLQLPGDAGTRFYDFGDAATQRRLEQEFRAGLERAATQPSERQSVVDEALDAFERHAQLFDELAAGR